MAVLGGRLVPWGGLGAGRRRQRPRVAIGKRVAMNDQSGSRRRAALLAAIALAAAAVGVVVPAGQALAVVLAPTVYVTNSGSGTVTPIDTATGAAGTPIRVGKDPDAVAISPDGAVAYVANFGSGTVTPIDTATGAAGTPIAVGLGPWGISFKDAAATAYVTNQ